MAQHRHPDPWGRIVCSGSSPPSWLGLPVRVVDAVPAYRAGLVSALRHAGCDADALDDPDQWADQEGRRVLLLTLRTQRDWEQLTRLGRRASPHLVLVALLTALTGAAHQAALQRGASAAVAWDAPLETVLDILAAALTGRVLLPLEIAVTLGHRQVEPETFTPQELEWLRQLVAGATTTAMAARSRLSSRTLYRRLADLYQRLGVQNRAGAIATATRWDLLDR
jgi:DNA-binding NarL/FixJ family response regulator